MPTSNSNSISWAQVAEMIRGHYREELCQGMKAALAVVTSLSIKKRDHCLFLVFEGSSGRGKSIIVRSAMPESDNQPFLERVDDFTPASFVSHASNRTREELDANDLLPRIKNKVMLTKELAPLFRDDEKELRQSFARLTSVLDGDGYRTFSGVHGDRGYVGRFVFNWIGATTPIPDRTHKVMAQLGNRILFYEVSGEECSEEDLMEFAQTYGANDAVEACRSVVNCFIEEHFKRHPIDSIEPEAIEMPEQALRQIVRYAQLIAGGRIEIDTDTYGNIEPGAAEGPHRVILLLQTLARGLALVEDRSVVTEDDLNMIRHVAFSSIPSRRRELLRALIAAGGTLDARQVEEAVNRTRPIAIERMKELAATGICEYECGDSRTSTPSRITLASDWAWLLEDPTPLNDSGVCEQTESSAAH